MGFNSAPQQETKKEVRNRVFELIDNHYLDNQINSARAIRGNEKRISLLKAKEVIFTFFLVHALGEEFYKGVFPADSLSDPGADPAFRDYVNHVRKERLVKMLEVNKMELEERLETEQDPEEKARQIKLIDAADDLIAELER